MVSTYLQYNLLTRDMKTSLNRTAEQTQVARDTAYYKENIGKVTTIDEFLDDYRLYSYAMKAHGLEDMTYAKAFMKKVLESDLNDDNSYANRLSDERYRNFAMAYSFSTGKAVVQTSAQEDAVIGLYNQGSARLDDHVRTETNYFNAAIDLVKTVDDLWGNERLRGYVLKSLRMDENMSYQHFKAVVTSDLNDPNSYVNTVSTNFIKSLQDKIDAVKASATPADLNNSGSAASIAIAGYKAQIDSVPDYRPLAAAFNFASDGTLIAGKTAMDAGQKANMNELYAVSQPRVTSSAALINRSYFEAHIKDFTSTSDLLSNSRMRSFIITAFGLPKATLTATLDNILTSDPNDPNSYVNKNGGEFNANYKELRKAFNFRADGTLEPGLLLQTPEQTKSTGDNYMTRYNDADDAADETLVKQFKQLIGTVSNVDDLLDDAKLMKVVLNAFDLQDEGDTRRKLKQVLTSDLADPKSYANSLKDPRYVNMVKAFNFNADGSVSPPILPQSQSEITLTAKNYAVNKSRFGTEDDKKKAKEEASYYAKQMEQIGSLDSLLKNKRLVDIILVANNIDPDSVTTDELNKIFKSDLNDPKSYVNTEADPRFREIVASFNFDKNGHVARPETAGIQTRRGVMETEDLYYNQTLEETEGDENAGVRLALYFRRKAASVGSAYDLLADNALMQVVRTAYQIPEGLSSADVDKQYAYINKVLDIKTLQDPAEVEKLLKRFTALYDVDNNVDTSAANMILAGQTGGISADALYTLMSLRKGG
ncbi:DUF1217 domain-containing protein [Rhizobium sp. YIM 134829]|uniref:DUF1217 domain-containing protein n=1 Tax=Rhizobium sp. YIM 134829 TaxID=3390453 RepID=UPI00397DE883